MGLQDTAPMAYLTDYSKQKKLLANMVDELATTNPHTTYAFYPHSVNDYEKGFKSLSYKQFSNLVNGLAWWLTAQLGKGRTLGTITYTGPNDIRQNAMILASSKAGYKLLLSSPRNQCHAVRALLDQLECQALFASDPKSSYASTIQEARPMPTYQVPTVEALLSEEFPHYSCSKTFEESKDSPLVILHTSGTTAAPKPITYTNDWAATYTQMLRSQLPPEEHVWEMKDRHLRNVRLLVMMPPFHAANLFLALFIPFANQTTIVLPPANQPPTVEVFIGAIKSIQVDSAFVAPHLISHIATNQKYMDITADRLQTLLSGGGKIVEAHGNVVSSRVRLMTLYGATEVGSVPDLTLSGPRQREMWNYMRPHPNAGWQFRLHDETETGVFYEAWIVKSNDLPIDQPVFKIYGEQLEYSTRDLFVPHPTVLGMWKWCGRIDDTICLRTGANVNPIVMENGISNVPGVQGVLMLGSECLRPLLLVEPQSPCETPDAKNDLLNHVWSAVENFNCHYFEDHRILKNHVLITDVRKPMVRSLKGSVQRRATANLYDTEMKTLFC